MDQVESSRCGVCRRSGPVVTPLDKLDCIYSRADNTILVLCHVPVIPLKPLSAQRQPTSYNLLSKALEQQAAQLSPCMQQHWTADCCSMDDSGYCMSDLVPGI